MIVIDGGDGLMLVVSRPHKSADPQYELL